MARRIRTSWMAGATLNAYLRKPDTDEIWNPSTSSWDSAPSVWTDSEAELYAVGLTDRKGNYYSVDVPSGIPDSIDFDFTITLQTGATPTASDPITAGGQTQQLQGVVVGQAVAGVITYIMGEGTFTAQNVLDDVNDILNRSETEVDDELREALLEVSQRVYSLKAIQTGTLAAGETSIQLPANTLHVDEVWNTTNEKRLEPIAFWQWRSGKFAGYCIRGNYIYLPEKTEDKDFTFYLTVEHPVDITTIYFGKKYFKAVCYKTALEVLAKKIIIDDQPSIALDRLEMKYERALSRLVDSESEGPAITKPNNIVALINRATDTGDIY